MGVGGMLTKRRKVNMSEAELKNEGLVVQNSVYIGMGLLLMVLGGGGYAPRLG